MTTIRNAGSKSIVDTLGAVSSLASTVSDTIGSVGRMSQALHAKADAYATAIEYKAALDKLDAKKIATQNWAVSTQERMLELNDRIKDKQLYESLLAQAEEAIA